MKPKLKEWLQRYLPAEIAGTLTAILSSLIAHQIWGNSIVTAYAGAWGENIGYYGIIIVREIVRGRKAHESYGFKTFLKTLRDLFLEFGLAEILDSFITRPFFMYIFPQLLNNYPLGILIGKFAADFTFYVPAIFSYEMRKKYF